MTQQLLSAYLRYISKGRRILHQLGCGDADLRIMQCLYIDRRAWSVSSVSDATGLTRVTVRRHLKDMETAGLAERHARGYRLTERGEEHLQRVFNEFLELVKVELLQFHRLLNKAKL